MVCGDVWCHGPWWAQLQRCSLLPTSLPKQGSQSHGGWLELLWIPQPLSKDCSALERRSFSWYPMGISSIPACVTISCAVPVPDGGVAPGPHTQEAPQGFPLLWLHNQLLPWYVPSLAVCLSLFVPTDPNWDRNLLAAGGGSCWHNPDTRASAARTTPGSTASIPALSSPGPAMCHHFTSASMSPSLPILHPSPWPAWWPVCLLGTEVSAASSWSPLAGKGRWQQGHSHGGSAPEDMPSPILSPLRSPSPCASLGASAVTLWLCKTRWVTQPVLPWPSLGAQPGEQGVQAPGTDRGAPGCVLSQLIPALFAWCTQGTVLPRRCPAGGLQSSRVMQFLIARQGLQAEGQSPMHKV